MSVRTPGSDRARQEDEQARLDAQTVFDRPLVLEAGAGTGKTTTLVARILSWCLGPGWEGAARRLEDRRPAGTSGQLPSSRDAAIAAETLGGVVAMTFTEAAAAEMGERVGSELERIVADDGRGPEWLLLPATLEDSPEGTAGRDGSQLCSRTCSRAGALLGALDHLSVRTIHAFCRGLLSAHPLEAGLHPVLTVDADGSLVETAVREEVEDRLREVFGDRPDPAFLALAARGLGPLEIAEALVFLTRAGFGARDLAEPFFTAGAVQGLARRFEEACRALFDTLSPALGGSGREGRLKTAIQVEEALAAVIQSFEKDPPDDLDELRSVIAGSGLERALGRLRDWRKGPKGKTESEVFAEAAAPLARDARRLVRVTEHLLRLDAELLEVAREALAPMLARIEDALRARGVLTFQALLAETAHLLRERRDVRARIRRKIDQILVDEFQDTDRLQCEILGFLTLDGPRDERPGLFIVGDPKQSIYGWRSADLASYEGLVDRVQGAGGEVRSLVRNFRSAQPILEEVERLVAPVMRKQAGLQPPFEPLLATGERAGSPGFESPESAGAERAAVEYWISWQPEDGRKEDPKENRVPSLATTRGSEADELEAGAIARDLAELHRGHGVPWGEAALLFRSSTGLETYLDALRRGGIPFHVTGDKSYYRRREVIEAAALVRTVLDPGDHLALLTLLRSSMVGVPDAALIPLWSRGLPKRMTELDGRRPAALEEIQSLIEEAAGDLPEGIPGLDALEDWDLALATAAGHLAAARASFARDPADVFVETLRRLFLPEAIEAARFLGPYRLANLERFFRQLGAALESGGDSAAVLRVLRQRVAEAAEAEEGRPRHGADDAVQVMTLHKAKGLEFTHVYLPQLHRRTRPPSRPANEAGVADEELELRLLGAAGPGFDRVEERRAAVEAAERVRLLYVAATRARERLVLLGRWPAAGTGPPPDRASCLLDLVLHRMTAAAAVSAGGAELSTDAAEIRAGAAKFWEDCRTTGTWWRRDGAGALWKLPALRPPALELEDPETTGVEAGERGAASTLYSPEEIAEAAVALAGRRSRARVRQARSLSGAASKEAHRRLGSGLEAELETGAPAPKPLGAGRAVAMAVGTAIHRFLEELDLEVLATGNEKSRQEEIELRRRSLRPHLGGLLPADLRPDLRKSGMERAEALLSDLAGSRLLRRLCELREFIVARELPILARPEESTDGPLVSISGAIDLLYRDPADGKLVIADYKTDRFDNEEELGQRVAAYGEQGRIYAHALREALDLDGTPRFELWLLTRDEVVEVGPTSSKP